MAYFRLSAVNYNFVNDCFGTFTAVASLIMLALEIIFASFFKFAIAILSCFNLIVADCRSLVL